MRPTYQPKRISKTRDYRHAYTAGTKLSAQSVTIYIVDSPGDYTRLGIVVGRRVSLKAVVRNRIKRVIRHWFGQHLPAALRSSYDIVVVVRPGAARGRAPAPLYADLQTVLKKWPL
ncbi:MAG: ribonuclease P protein component [Dehalococcoidia bacterium]|nr:MAG: ribonuclease P protein component [Dehalococcoidia bacterium]